MGIGSIVSIVGTCVGVCGLAFGLYQYVIAQRWKRAEFAASELNKLHTDPELALCCTMLDWSSRRVPVPPKYAPLTEETTFVHTWEKLGQAMRPEEEVGEFPWPGIVYRDTFDRMFTYLSSIENSLRIGLIDMSHVMPLEYWLREISRPRFAQGRSKDVLVKFARAYEYGEVLSLIERFGITTPGPLTDLEA